VRAAIPVVVLFFSELFDVRSIVGTTAAGDG
jgi:hypothetical protein